jgi:hypothetical protein
VIVATFILTQPRANLHALCATFFRRSGLRPARSAAIIGDRARYSKSSRLLVVALRFQRLCDESVARIVPELFEFRLTLQDSIIARNISVRASF